MNKYGINNTTLGQLSVNTALKQHKKIDCRALAICTSSGNAGFYGVNGTAKIGQAQMLNSTLWKPTTVVIDPGHDFITEIEIVIINRSGTTLYGGVVAVTEIR
jgi:hypothetical protein